MKHRVKVRIEVGPATPAETNVLVCKGAYNALVRTIADILTAETLSTTSAITKPIGERVLTVTPTAYKFGRDLPAEGQALSVEEIELEVGIE